MKKIFTAAVAAVMMVAATGASAATKTFEATVSNVTGGTELLDELFGTSPDRILTLKLRVTFDTLLSNPFSGSGYYSLYDSYSLIAPEKTIIAVDSSLARRLSVYSRNANSISFNSSLGSPDPASYRSFSLSATDDDSGWSRSTTPVTADLLNSFSSQTFSLDKYVRVNGSDGAQAVSSTRVTWAEVPAVPLPAGLPLLLAGLGALGIASRRRRS